MNCPHVASSRSAKGGSFDALSDETHILACEALVRRKSNETRWWQIAPEDAGSTAWTCCHLATHSHGLPSCWGYGLTQNWPNVSEKLTNTPSDEMLTLPAGTCSVPTHPEATTQCVVSQMPSVRRMRTAKINTRCSTLRPRHCGGCSDCSPRQVSVQSPATAGGSLRRKPRVSCRKPGKPRPSACQRLRANSHPACRPAPTQQPPCETARSPER